MVHRCVCAKGTYTKAGRAEKLQSSPCCGLEEPRCTQERFHGRPVRRRPAEKGWLAGSRGCGTWLGWQPRASAGAGPRGRGSPGGEEWGFCVAYQDGGSRAGCKEVPEPAQRMAAISPKSCQGL